MLDNRNAWLVPTVLWTILVVPAVWLRPLLPMDETRYLAVAWEMWQRGDFLVPYLNGEPYSHKPPLLFWGMHLGWALFGVNDWWPRLVAPMFGLASLLLTARLGRLLWPIRPMVGPTAAMLVLGALFWTLFTTMTMFDMLHAACTLGGLLGLILVVRGRRWGGFLLFGLSIGVGVVGKGPAILVHLLPVALSAPVWARRLGYQAGWRRWYAGVAASVALGAGIGLSWALPAAAAGGEEYRDAILWGQSAGRMVDSFAHGRPFWWFATVLPVMVLPWVIWPAVWRAVGGQWREMTTDGGARFCLIWFGAAFVAFSAISGKQPHYLVPEFPALGLLLAYMISGAVSGAGHAFWRPIDRILPALLFLVIVTVIAVVFHFDLKPSWATSAGDAQLWPLTGLVLAILLCWRVKAGAVFVRVGALTVASVAAVLVIHLALRPLMAESHDFREFSATLKSFEDRGYDFVTFGKYHGQFHFLGRLSKPFGVVDGPVTLDAWLKHHPKAIIVALHETLVDEKVPVASTRFRGRVIGAWRSDEYPPRVERLNAIK